MIWRTMLAKEEFRCQTTSTGEAWEASVDLVIVSSRTTATPVLKDDWLFFLLYLDREFF